MLPTLLATLLLAPALAAEVPAIQRDDPSWVAARAELATRRASLPEAPRARNVILFVGDGMGVSTLTAARVLEGQRRGTADLDHLLAFEAFDHVALVRTWNVDGMVPDSAGTASALNTGVRTRLSVVATPAAVPRGDCAAHLATPPLASIAWLAHTSGRATGVVSTTRLTHATPAAVYAHAPDRGWESDADVPADVRAACPDIASQLASNAWLDVALGGGRSRFLPTSAGGRRRDGRDLLAAWRDAHPGGHLVTDRAGLVGLPDGAAPVLGLFDDDHLPFHAETRDVPTLVELVDAALDVLQADPDGFFLLVESGRIDHAHHAGMPQLALDETIALSDAVRHALSRVDAADTLVLVTADHDHTFTMGGHVAAGRDVLGWAGDDVDAAGNPVPERADDGRPYPILGYANGPGGARHVQRVARDPRKADPTSVDYRPPALVPLRSETHAAHDVPLFAQGAGAGLVRGHLGQPTVFHVMAEVMGLLPP